MKYQADRHTPTDITEQFNYLSVYEEILYDFGTEIANYIIPYEGYTFEGWYMDSNLLEQYTGTLVPNYPLYALYKGIQYAIFFDENDGSIVNDLVQDYGTDISLPIPTRSGYTFDGRYTDDGTYLDEFDFLTMPAEDTILYAKWIVD